MEKCKRCLKHAQITCDCHATPYCSIACHDNNMSKQPFVVDIVEATLNNKEFGPVVLYRDPSGHLEVTVMSVPKDKVVPGEIHKSSTQFIHVVKGQGRINIGETITNLKEGSVAVVPTGIYHKIWADTLLKLYTLYTKDTAEIWAH